MIKKTSAMPEGSFKTINRQRYIAALIIFSALLIEAFFISGFYERNCDSLYTSFGMGFLIFIGGLIAGVGGNKIVTGQQESAPPPSAVHQQEREREAQVVNGNGNVVAGGDIRS
jgi:hypothetical protein